MPLPYIDIVSGIQYGAIPTGAQFEWKNTGNVQAWVTTNNWSGGPENPFNVPANTTSAPVTAPAAAGIYTWSSGVNVNYPANQSLYVGMPSVSVQTGDVTGFIAAGGQFQLINSSSNNCQVTKQTSNWFSGANPFPVPPGTSLVTATSTPGTYQWSSPCCSKGMPHVGIGAHK